MVQMDSVPPSGYPNSDSVLPRQRSPPLYRSESDLDNSNVLVENIELFKPFGADAATRFTSRSGHAPFTGLSFHYCRRRAHFNKHGIINFDLPINSAYNIIHTHHPSIQARTPQSLPRLGASPAPRIHRQPAQFRHHRALLPHHEHRLL